MAQLPPKIPSLASNLSSFSQQKSPSMASLAANGTTQNASWVDEFLDFSSAKRGLHRRSVSDSVAYLETPITVVEEEYHRSSAAPGRGNTANEEFERFDDDQFMSMFTDEMSMAVGPPVSSSNPSTPSDHNSINEEKPTPSDHHHHCNHHHHHHLNHHQQQQQQEQEQEQELLLQQQQQQLKNESEEVASSCKLDAQALPSTSSQMTITTPTERIADPRRVKRILANRQSAQRSRVRKLQYISELERNVTTLQTEVSVLSPRVAFLDHQRLLLNVDNSALKQRIAALAQDKIFKDAQQEALKREIERLRQVYQQKNLRKMENATPPPPPLQQLLTSPEGKDSTEKEEPHNA